MRMGRETLSGSSEGPKRWRATGAVVWDHEISEVLPPEARIRQIEYPLPQSIRKRLGGI